MVTSMLALLWLAGPAAAEPDPTEPTTAAPIAEPAPAPAPTALAEPEPPVVGSFEAVLREAKQRYFQGDVTGARELLSGLEARVVAGEEAAWELVVDALTYYGEIQYEAGDREQASATFRLLLERDVQTPISPYHHPLEVVNVFEAVRANVLRDRDIEPPPIPVDPRAAPIWTFFPFGVPQLGQGRTVAGVVYGGLQTGMIITSFAMAANLRFINTDPEASGLDLTPTQVRRQVQFRRYAVQWPVTIGFYALWGVSAIDGARWHRKHALDVTVVPGPSPGLALSGRF